MSAYVSIIRVEKKKRYYFSNWHQDDFIEDIKFLISKITKSKK